MGGGYGLDWCTDMFGVYVATQTKAHINGQWVEGSRSVGFTGAGFHEARFSDGTSHVSTSNVRGSDLGAFTYECFELPCLEDGHANLECAAEGHVSVGVSGFNL